MKIRRRSFFRSLAAGAVFTPAWKAAAGQLGGAPAVKTSRTYDAVVVGAGSFGAWTAYYLQQRGLKVALLDAYGPANSRASSGGESRIIR
ncbi:MAG: FAD-dependent oxidoreductase, partial [Acidobacteria bacterium]|nr:FAD-dependent oxidoreductase [Acidobacteriota bacterium]